MPRCRPRAAAGQAALFFNRVWASNHRVDRRSVCERTEYLKEIDMQLSRRAYAVALAGALSLGACAGSASESGDVAPASDALKGGIPANGKDKANGKMSGRAGADALNPNVDTDAGVKHGALKGTKHKTKNPKAKGSKDKAAHGPKADGGLSDVDGDEDSDETETP